MFTKFSELICFAKFIDGQNMSKISQRQTWGGTFLWRTDWNWNKWRWDHLCLQYLLSSLQSRITFCHMLLFYFHLYVFVFVHLNSYWIDNGCTDCKKWKWQWVKLKVATNRESCNKWKWEWQQKSETYNIYIYFNRFTWLSKKYIKSDIYQVNCSVLKFTEDD